MQTENGVRSNIIKQKKIRREETSECKTRSLISGIYHIRTTMIYHYVNELHLFYSFHILHIFSYALLPLFIHSCCGSSTMRLHLLQANMQNMVKLKTRKYNIQIDKKNLNIVCLSMKDMSHRTTHSARTHLMEYESLQYFSFLTPMLSSVFILSLK